MNKDKAIETLEKSPLFHLSLASKELFHSNFLYWLAMNYAEIVNGVFRNLLNGVELKLYDGNYDYGCKVDYEASKARVRREEYNFDFCVHKSSNGASLVLENKVKSIPRLDQIEEYDKKIEKHKDVFRERSECAKCLLTLVSDFLGKEEIERRGWKVISYGDFAEELENSVGDICDNYHAQIIDDYISYVRNLYSLTKYWKVEMSDLFLETKNDDDLSVLRLNDLKLKVRMQYFVSLMCERLEEFSKKRGLTLQFKGIKGITKSNASNSVFVQTEFTNGTPVVSVRMKYNNKVVFGIQIQDRQYRRFVESYDKSEVHEEDYCGWWLQEGGVKEVYHNDFLSPNNGTKEFCKYTKIFKYQYCKIQDKATMSQVINGIISDLNLIFENVKK